jgi:hypothetical protein
LGRFNRKVFGMLLRLAVLGTLGYLGYRELQKSQGALRGSQNAPRPIALAGGPLSDQARIQSDPDAPPAASSGQFNATQA